MKEAFNGYAGLSGISGRGDAVARWQKGTAPAAS
jgi:hypothetical protein